MQAPSLPFGASRIQIEHADFGTGYEQHLHHYGQGGLPIDSSTLLFLIRNGFAPGISETWQTGYIVGWLAACYEGGIPLSEDSTGESLHTTQGVA